MLDLIQRLQDKTMWDLLNIALALEKGCAARVPKKLIDIDKSIIKTMRFYGFCIYPRWGDYVMYRRVNQ